MALNREREKQKARRMSAREWAKKPSLSGSESTCCKLPDGFEWFKLSKAEVVKVDFLPYTAGKFNRRADEGTEHFELEYEAHRVPTGNGVRLYICRHKVFNKPCAVCDWLKKYGSTADEELIGKLRATTRHLWVVNDEPGNVKNSLKVYDSNHYNKKKGFGEQMAVAINTLDENADPFALVGGYTAVLTVEEDSFPGGKYFLCSRIDLRPRKVDYPASVLTKAPCLDDCLIDPGYDSVMQLLETGGDTGSTDRNGDDDAPVKSRSKPTPADDEDDDDDDDEPVPARKSSQAAVKDEDDDDDDEDEPVPPKKAGKGKVNDPTAEDMGIVKGTPVVYKGEQCEVVKVSGDGTSLTLEDEDGEKYTGVAPSAVKRVAVKEDEDDDEPPPPVKSKGKKTAPVDDDDEDDEPAPKKGKAKAPVDEDEDDEDDDDDEDPIDDDEDDEPAPPKKKGRK